MYLFKKFKEKEKTNDKYEQSYIKLLCFVYNIHFKNSAFRLYLLNRYFIKLLFIYTNLILLFLYCN